jgi:lipopolysaccharide/colanic/teichoic acid biosynthesis glycosyltransferase
MAIGRQDASLVAEQSRGAYAAVPRRSFYQRRGKRALDLGLGAPLLLLALPVIVLLAFLTMLTSGWPPFYAARRMGVGGREFSMWKIRTMRRDADESRLQWSETHPELALEYALYQKVRNDPRVTRLGAILRRASLDELPQLWNVVRGDMSLVGPRPYFFEELVETPGVLGVICSVKPGLTGPWQVGGRNRLLPDERMELDRQYARDVSPSSDLRYLLGTARCILRMDGI